MPLKPYITLSTIDAAAYSYTSDCFVFVSNTLSKENFKLSFKSLISAVFIATVFSSNNS